LTLCCGCAQGGINLFSRTSLRVAATPPPPPPPRRCGKRYSSERSVCMCPKCRRAIRTSGFLSAQVGAKNRLHMLRTRPARALRGSSWSSHAPTKPFTVGSTLRGGSGGPEGVSARRRRKFPNHFYRWGVGDFVGIHPTLHKNHERAKRVQRDVHARVQLGIAARRAREICKSVV